LHSAPGFHEAGTIGGTERPDVETLHAICALIESSFRSSPAAALLQGAVIFSATKLSAQFFTTAFSARNQCGDGHDRNYEYHAANDYHCCRVHTNYLNFLAKAMVRAGISAFPRTQSDI
jgi:hypothetical protein